MERRGCGNEIPQPNEQARKQPEEGGISIPQRKRQNAESPDAETDAGRRMQTAEAPMAPGWTANIPAAKPSPQRHRSA